MSRGWAVLAVSGAIGGGLLFGFGGLALGGRVAERGLGGRFGAGGRFGFAGRFGGTGFGFRQGGLGGFQWPVGLEPLGWLWRRRPYRRSRFSRIWRPRLSPFVPSAAFNASVACLRGGDGGGWRLDPRRLSAAVALRDRGGIGGDLLHRFGRF